MEIHFLLAELPQVALQIWQKLRVHKPGTLALHGEMGVGKTTFTSALLQAMGSADVVQSPTFSIINEYEVPGMPPVYHMDLYRLQSEQEAIEAGVEELMYSGAWCIVEWPDKGSGLLPANTFHFVLKNHIDGYRTLIWEE